MGEEVIFSGKVRITEEEVKIECSPDGNIMIFFDGEPIFMLYWHELALLYKKATHKRREGESE